MMNVCLPNHADAQAAAQQPAATDSRTRCVPVPAEHEPAPKPIERHYTAGEVADLWHFNVETVRRIFEHEPGVMVLQAPTMKRKRVYKTLRIPQTVLNRVHKRLQIA
jgi:hypothetical protein